MKKVMALVLTGIMLLGLGCDLDSLTGKDDDDNGSQPTRISDLTMGGILIYSKEANSAIAEFGTLFGTSFYENARIFVNGIELHNNNGLFTNESVLDSAKLGSTVRVVVYAFGDSVVHTLGLPEAPVIYSPLASAQLGVGDSLTIELSYPGAHQYISMALTNQNGVTSGGESAEQGIIPVGVPASLITHAGESTILAMSANLSGEIPAGVNLDDQYNIFVVGTLTQRTVTFVNPQ